MVGHPDLLNDLFFDLMLFLLLLMVLHEAYIWLRRREKRPTSHLGARAS